MAAISLLFKVLGGVGIAAVSLLDLFSLYLLNLKYGIGAALLAFFSGIGLVIAPFLVGTWVPTIILIAAIGGCFMVAAVLESRAPASR